MRLFRRCPTCDKRCGDNKKDGVITDQCPVCGTSLKNLPWSIDYYVNGVRKREAISVNKRLAEEVIAKREVQIKEGRFFEIKRKKHCSLQEIADDFLAYSRNNKKSYKRDVQLVSHLLFFFKNKKLDQITPALIEEYKSKRLNRDARKPATVNREIACLKCMFNWAIKNGKAESNPMKQVKLLRENNTRLRYLSNEEIAKLLESCNDHIKPIVMTALTTGMRQGEILSLKWTDVNLEQGIIIIRNSKNGKMREVPICTALDKVLKECHANSDKVHVFCNESKKPYSSINSMFQRIIKRSGIQDFCFHDLRHTAASYLIMLGIDLVTVKEILGHSNINMTLRYSHLSPFHKREAMEVLGTKMVTFWSHGVGGNSEVKICAL